MKRNMFIQRITALILAFIFTLTYFCQGFLNINSFALMREDAIYEASATSSDAISTSSDAVSIIDEDGNILDGDIANDSVIEDGEVKSATSSNASTDALLPVEISFIIPQDDSLSVAAPASYSDATAIEEERESKIAISLLDDRTIAALDEISDKEDEDATASNASIDTDKILQAADKKVTKAKKDDDQVVGTTDYDNYIQITNTDGSIAAPKVTIINDEDNAATTQSTSEVLDTTNASEDALSIIEDSKIALASTTDTTSTSVSDTTTDTNAATDTTTDTTTTTTTDTTTDSTTDSLLSDDSIAGWQVAATAGVSLAYADGTPIVDGEIISTSNLSSISLLSTQAGVAMLSQSNTSLVTLLAKKQDFTTIVNVGSAGTNGKWSVVVQGGTNNTSTAGTMHHAYGTLAAALAAINADSGSAAFKITFVDDYTCDASDIAALGTGNNTGAITRSDKITIIYSGNAKYIDDTGYQTVSNFSVPSSVATMIYIGNHDAYFTNIKISTSASSNIICNQNNTTWDNIIWGTQISVLCGGGYTVARDADYTLTYKNIEDTTSAYLHHIFVGAWTAAAAQTGDATLNMSDCVFYGNVSGAANGNQDGNMTINITDTKLYKTSKDTNGAAYFSDLTGTKKTVDQYRGSMWNTGGNIWLTLRGIISGDATANLTGCTFGNIAIDIQGIWWCYVNSGGSNIGDIKGNATINCLKTDIVSFSPGFGTMSDDSQISSSNKSIHYSGTSTIDELAGGGTGYASPIFMGYDTLVVEDAVLENGYRRSSYCASYLGQLVNAAASKENLTAANYKGQCTLNGVYMTYEPSAAIYSYTTFHCKTLTLTSQNSYLLVSPNVNYIPITVDASFTSTGVKMLTAFAGVGTANTTYPMVKLPTAAYATSALTYIQPRLTDRSTNLVSGVNVAMKCTKASNVFSLFKGDYDGGTGTYLADYATFSAALAAMIANNSSGGEYSILLNKNYTFLAADNTYIQNNKASLIKYKVHMTNGSKQAMPGSSYSSCTYFNHWYFKELIIESGAFNYSSSSGVYGIWAGYTKITIKGGVRFVGGTITWWVPCNYAGSYNNNKLDITVEQYSSNKSTTQYYIWTSGPGAADVNATFKGCVNPLFSLSNGANGNAGNVVLNAEDCTGLTICRAAEAVSGHGSTGVITGNLTSNIKNCTITKINAIQTRGAIQHNITDSTILGPVYGCSPNYTSGSTDIEIYGDVKVVGTTNDAAGIYDFGQLNINGTDDGPSTLTIGDSSTGITGALYYLGGYGTRVGRVGLKNGGRLVMAAPSTTAQNRTIQYIQNDGNENNEISVGYTGVTGAGGGTPLVVASKYSTAMLNKDNTLRVSTVKRPTHAAKSEYELITFASGEDIDADNFEWIADKRYYIKKGEISCTSNQLVLRLDEMAPVIFQAKVDQTTGGEITTSSSSSYGRKIEFYVRDFYRDGVDPTGEDLVEADDTYIESTYAQVYISHRDIEKVNGIYPYTYEPDEGDALAENLASTVEKITDTTTAISDINGDDITPTLTSPLYHYILDIDKLADNTILDFFDQDSNIFIYARDLAGNWSKYMLDIYGPKCTYTSQTVSDISKTQGTYTITGITLTDPAVVPTNGTQVVSDTSFSNSGNATDINTTVLDEVYYNTTGSDPWVNTGSTKLTKEADGTYSITSITLADTDTLYLYAIDAYGNKNIFEFLPIRFDATAGGVASTGHFTDNTTDKVVRVIKGASLATTQYPDTAYSGSPKLATTQEFVNWYDASDDTKTGESAFQRTVTSAVTYYPSWEEPTITVTKRASGAYANRQKEFNYTLTIKDSDGALVADGTKITIDDVEYETASGEVAFSAKHAQKRLIDGIPIGYKIIIEENSDDAKNYIPTITDSFIDATVSDASNILSTGEIEIVAEDRTIKYVNQRIEIVPTGVDAGDMSPVMLMTMLTMTGIVALYLLYKKNYKTNV